MTSSRKINATTRAKFRRGEGHALAPHGRPVDCLPVGLEYPGNILRFGSATAPPRFGHAIMVPGRRNLRNVGTPISMRRSVMYVDCIRPRDLRNIHSILQLI